jgi:hypothetical protein
MRRSTLPAECQGAPCLQQRASGSSETLAAPAHTPGWTMSSMRVPPRERRGRSCSALLSLCRTHPKPSATAGYALSGHDRPIGGIDSALRVRGDVGEDRCVTGRVENAVRESVSPGEPLPTPTGRGLFKVERYTPGGWCSFLARRKLGHRCPGGLWREFPTSCVAGAGLLLAACTPRTANQAVWMST